MGGDAQTQLSYNYYRDYNPKIGRYAQSDPIGLNGGLNSYTYVGSNPLSYIDPRGLDTVSIGGSIAFPGFFHWFLPSDAPPSGAGCGIALSYPGFLGGDWDIGVFTSVQAGGETYGFGRGALDVGYHNGSVSDLAGERAQVGAHLGRFGADVEFDDASNVSGVNVHIGPGFNFGGTGSLNGVYSLKGGLRGK